MKTKINDTYIDTNEVAAIGPLSSAPRLAGGESGRFSFGVWLKGKAEHLVIDPTGESFDPYNLASDSNNAVKERAKAAYSVFIDAWQNT